MNLPSSTPDGNPTPGTPLDDFSQCHVGIAQRLADLHTLQSLLEPAARARRIAAELARFYTDVIREHHQEEENELFPAVLSSASAGAERNEVKTLADRLTREHRDIEAGFDRLLPALKAAAKGHDAALDGNAVEALIAAYRAHAAFEEATFLPRSQQILSRNGNHMAALGLSMHLRHALPEVLAKFGNRI